MLGVAEEVLVSCGPLRVGVFPEVTFEERPLRVAAEGDAGLGTGVLEVEEVDLAGDAGRLPLLEVGLTEPGVVVVLEGDEGRLPLLAALLREVGVADLRLTLEGDAGLDVELTTLEGVLEGDAGRLVELTFVLEVLEGDAGRDVEVTSVLAVLEGDAGRDVELTLVLEVLEGDAGRNAELKEVVEDEGDVLSPVLVGMAGRGLPSKWLDAGEEAGGCMRALDIEEVNDGDLESPGAPPAAFLPPLEEGDFVN